MRAETQLQGRSQRDGSSPTLIVVVSAGEEEERGKGEKRERAVKMAAASSLFQGIAGKNTHKNSVSVLLPRLRSEGIFLLCLVPRKAAEKEEEGSRSNRGNGGRFGRGERRPRKPR